METLELLKDIGQHSNGDCYLGVVGPVRVGKSTFIKRFMEVAVLPFMDEGEIKNRARDELPQSGDGKTIMTMEPKFIPSNAISLKIEENLSIQVRLIDCVGFLIDSASGYLEDGKMRMVKTPWFSEEIPFDEASRIGTEKVIKEHSTLGIVILSDGTINDFSRSDYESAERKVIEEMNEINKPYIIILNSKTPGSKESEKLRDELKEKYQVPVLLIDILHMQKEHVDEILKEALYQFPVNGIDLTLPSWVYSLDENHPLRSSLQASIDLAMQEIKIVRDVEGINAIIAQNEYVASSSLVGVDTGNGIVTIQVEIKEGIYEQVLHDLVGCEISDKAQLIAVLTQYVKAKKDYDLIGNALKMAEVSGYGFASSSLEDMKIEKPTIVKSGNRYGIRVKATAPTYHIIKTEVDTSFEPILGSKEQAEFFVNYLLESYEKDPLKILDCEMFGRKFKDIISQGISLKLDNLPEPIKVKLQQLIKTISNKGKGNLIAFVF